MGGKDKGKCRLQLFAKSEVIIGGEYLTRQEYLSTFFVAVTIRTGIVYTRFFAVRIAVVIFLAIVAEIFVSSDLYNLILIKPFFKVNSS